MLSDNTDRISVRHFGELDDGRSVKIFTLKNKQGTRVEIMDLGAIIVSLNTVDALGNFADITLGYDEPQDYLTANTYMGAVVGRYGNRIANGKFSLSSVEYTLARNNGDNALHGGIVGFDKKIWQTSSSSDRTSAELTLALISEDGDEGYPGQLNTTVTYILNDDNQLVVQYFATSDQATVINLTQHAYFNLDGHDSGSILDHEMMINADHYTPTDAESIPLGEIENVAGTPFDFRRMKKIGRDISLAHEQLVFGSGYDQNFVLNQSEAGELVLAASAFSADSGRNLTVYTDQPGMQFYTGNFLNDRVAGKNGTIYQSRGAFCLETQHYPDSPNQPQFPSTVLLPGQQYSTQTIFQFGVGN